MITGTLFGVKKQAVENSLSWKIKNLNRLKQLVLALCIKNSVFQVNIYLPVVDNKVLFRSSQEGQDFLNINRKD